MEINEKVVNEIAENMLSIFPMLMKNIFKKDEFTEEYGLGPRYMHILHLIDDFGPMSISEISKRLSVSAPNMTPLIERLISEGYVIKNSQENDRRISIIQLTPKGRELVLLHTNWLNQNLKKRLERLSHDEIEELWYVLKRLKKLVLKMADCCKQREGN
ncbi:MarR family winged helix-turn-helix transcriptional regulator [Caldicellulosiruptor morganii]|uniref:MarR family transcriptional regulator n=1 Tax=Caldicellulosiruptor morganii TaxID=1387555 RepID=A0ABY7BSP7_9FIRM|nr:MarR family transcriptional regulator [Caldicellulosiruptor morganii]WAM35025.1 MarR family transcriptional regulator [Caldicellulosiruptor morganii]